MDKEIHFMSTDISGMYTLISPVNEKWKEIGLKLGLYASTLEAIELEKCNIGRADRCLYSVLTSWLHSKDDVWKIGKSWSVLVQALQSVGADEQIIKGCKEAAMASAIGCVRDQSGKSSEHNKAKQSGSVAKPSLRELIHLEVATDWYSLGLELGLPEHMLNVIDQDNRSDCKTCMRKMFSKWLSTNKAADYKDIIKGLIAINKKDTAEKVSQQYLGKSIYDDNNDTSIRETKSICLPKNSKLVNYLTSRYCFPSCDKDEWPKSVQMKYINLSLITKKKKFNTLNSMQSSVELTKEGNIQHIPEQSQSIALENILQYDMDKKVVLIEGSPGVGKTTLTTKLCTDWAKRQLLKEYPLVMCFPLREPLVRVAESLKELLDFFGDNYSEEDVAYIKDTQGINVLIILDGWDELRPSCRGEDMFFPKLVRGEILPSCCIIITSRSGPQTELIRHFAPNPRFIEILGFTNEQIQNYIEAYFKQEDTPEAGRKLLKDLESYPNVANACYIAINLAIVCYVYCAGDYELPSTLTEVYEAFVIHTILRYFKKLRRQMDDCTIEVDAYCEFESFDNGTKLMLKNLGRLALDGISSNDLCFSQQQLFEICEPDETFVQFDGFGLLKLLHVTRRYRTEYFYHFLHLTIQEWLAAHYLTQLSDSDFITWLGENYRNPQFRLVIQFLCGINQFKSTSLRLFVPEIEIDFAVCAWIFEGQWKKGCEKLAQKTHSIFQFGHPAIRQTLQPYDSMVLMYVLSNANTMWKLSYNNFQISDQVLAKMSETFVLFPNLVKEFTIQRVNIHASSAILFGKIVNSQIQLTSLALTQTDLNDDAMADFCDSLIEHKTMEKFDVSKNNLSSLGALSLSSLFSKFVVLQHFDISHNNIGLDGCNCLIDAINSIKGPHQIQSLNVSILQSDRSKLSTVVNKDLKLSVINY